MADSLLQQAGQAAPDVQAPNRSLTRVEAVYYKHLQDGMTKKDAAKLAQKETGLALVTGRPIKRGQFEYGKHTRDGQTGLTNR